MNVLICLGRNYRDFAPLNQYVLSTARTILGALDSIFYMQELVDIFRIIKDVLKVSDRCLMIAPKEKFDEILKTFVVSEKKRIKMKFENAICVKNTQMQIILLDLQNATQEELMQIFRMQGVVRDYENMESLLYLYPLGIEATSAQMLLNGIAKDFGVWINVLNAESHLEVLSAMNGDLQGFKLAIKKMFGNKIFATFDLARSIIELLGAQDLKITSVESCTGGLIAATLTRKSGASKIFDGAMISYANAIKEAWLGVSAEKLSSYGAVSEAVVRDMLDGALRLSGADFALATSGIAGPDGGSANKPIGTMYIGVKSTKGEEIIERLYFRGNRNFIQEQGALYAYLLFLKIFFKNY